MLLLPLIQFAQAPPMGTAADFVLFSSVGAVSNVGTYKYLTHLTGNVGTNSGSSTNFGNVNGVMHDGDGASTQCAADLLLAYNTLSAAITDSTLGSVIGNGTTIRPGIFLLPGATSLNLGLTLNGQGNPNAVFIFKTPSAVAYAFTANPNSKIHLINGAKACNVFWQISGAVNIGAGATIRGNIIAHGAISMGAQDTLEGRALTVNGAITVSNGALGFLAYTPIGCGSQVLVGPTAPTFVATGSYAVFATTGSASDCGTSRIIGDVGGNTVAPTGFNPDSITGTIHFNDPSTNAAAADLLLVYTYLLSLPYDIKLMDPAEFGHNLVLTPHAYQMDAAVTFTDTLYLDAQGNPDAVFVIKTFGAFASTPGAKVVFLNGTQAKNVYWFCTAAVSIGANSIFKGAIIAHDAIDMLPGSKLSGRVFSTHGAISTCGMTASLPSLISTEPADQAGCAGSSVSFSVTASGTALTYQWRKGTLHLVNGGNISGVTTSTLTINPANLSDAGVNYNVVISGPSIPNQTSRYATLTVLPLTGPAGPITGLATACQGVSGYVYQTSPILNATGYNWTIPVGGTITAGANTNMITVSYGANAVPGNVIVYGLGLCNNGSPAQLLINVNASSTPIIAGPSIVCSGISGNLYSTEAGMSGYDWILSSGGLITSGAGTNLITVTWTMAGLKTASVNYSNGAGCSAATPTLYNVTVNALPVPIIAGNALICQGLTGTYTTQTGQSAYLWGVSSGGQILSGQGTSSVNIKWNGSGMGTVSVNHSNINGCTAISPTLYSVTVNAVPVPTITGTTELCATSGYYIYTTEPGMTAYNWNISSGGSIFTGQGTNILYVYWGVVGTQTVSLNYTNSNGCIAINPALLTVNVYTIPGAAGAVSGPSLVCAGQQDVVYSVAPVLNATAYAWNLPAGAIVTNGAYTNSITVSFAVDAQSGSITAQGNTICGSGTASPALNVTVDPLPAAAGAITGSATVCSGAQAVAYSVGTIAIATGYTWTLPAGATIAGGANTNAITVNFGTASGNVSVVGTNACGSGYTSPAYAVNVSPKPDAPVVTLIGNVMTSSSVSGNQWYHDGNMLVGATSQTYTAPASQPGFYWTIVNLTGCSSDESNHIYIQGVGINENTIAKYEVYPVPSDGLFTASLTYPVAASFNITVYNQLGVMIYQKKDILVNGTSEQQIDIRSAPAGIYTVVFTNSDSKTIRKVLVIK